MNKKLINLKNAGCAIDSALDRTLNDDEFLLTCINQALVDNNFNDLGDALKKEDFKAAFEYSHTLKGILANVGLTPLYDIIVQIVEPLRKNNTANLTVKYNALIVEKQKLSLLTK
ncbi:MAG: Hpt domain-containing protein [Oscillospiraceae bacterium]|nr:Hpt domain-containing protein [Oscillospiraceae bacterium]